LVHGPRGDSYDHPHTDYSRTVDIFNAVTGHNLTAAEGVLFMHAVKMSRIGRGMQAAFTPGEMRDSIVDAAGYIECFWMTLEKENPRGHLQP
jgi:hypothetical protein